MENQYLVQYANQIMDMINVPNDTLYVEDNKILINVPKKDIYAFKYQGMFEYCQKSRRVCFNAGTADVIREITRNKIKVNKYSLVLNDSSTRNRGKKMIILVPLTHQHYISKTYNVSTHTTRSKSFTKLARSRAIEALISKVYHGTFMFHGESDRLVLIKEYVLKNMKEQEA